MIEKRNWNWRVLKNYCILDTHTTEYGRKESVTEFCCIKVKHNKIVDTLTMKINPNNQYRKYKYDYPELADCPTMDQAMPTLLEFIGKYNLVGYCLDRSVQYIESNCSYFFNCNFVDTFEHYYRFFHERLIPCSLENVYKYNTPKSKYVECDFNNLDDRCRVIKYLYDCEIDFNILAHSGGTKLIDTPKIDK